MWVLLRHNRPKITIGVSHVRFSGNVYEKLRASRKKYAKFSWLSLTRYFSKRVENGTWKTLIDVESPVLMTTNTGLLMRQAKNYL